MAPRQFCKLEWMHGNENSKLNANLEFYGSLHITYLLLSIDPKLS